MAEIKVRTAMKMKKDHFTSKGAGKIKKYHPHEIHMDYPQENFAKEYEFQKGMPKRSPMRSKWEHEHIVNEDSYAKEHKPMEYRLVRGMPHGYGHSVGQRAGHLRTSGHPKAHRIGKR